MSFDDGSLGQRGDGTSASSRPEQGPLKRLTTLPRALARRLKRHAREWPRRYVEMRTAHHERDSE